MRRAALLLALGLLAAPAAAQEVQLEASRPGTARPLHLLASYADGGWTIGVGDGSGRESQRFVVQSEVSDPPPWVADADGDGAGDLWVPVLAGNANTAYQLWRMDPRRGEFRAAGEIGGLEFARDPGGWLVAMGRNGCCAVSQVFYSFPRGGGAPREAFTIERTLRPDGRVQRCTGSRGAPQDVVRPWCNAATEGWPPGVTALR
jgi:hypothetical protein